MGHHLQQKKIMLPSLEYRIFYFWLKFFRLPNYLDNIFQNPALSYLSIYGEMSWCKTFRKSTKQILRKMHHWRMDRQTNGWTERTDFIGLFCKDGSLIMFFGNMRIKFSWIIWLDSEKYGKDWYKKKEHNQHGSVFTELKNNDS